MGMDNDIYIVRGVKVKKSDIIINSVYSAIGGELYDSYYQDTGENEADSVIIGKIMREIEPSKTDSIFRINDVDNLINTDIEFIVSICEDIAGKRYSESEIDLYIIQRCW